jgi:hypothetical protein
MVDAAYQKLLARKLYLTPANYARIVVVPSGTSSGEVAMSLYSNDGEEGAVRLTTTRGERDLWTAASELDPLLRKEPRIEILRRDVRFPKELAIAIRATLKHLIKQSREPTGSNRMVVDGTHILYMVDEGANQRLQARLAPESVGPTTNALRDLTNALQQYDTATLPSRVLLEARIQSELKRLAEHGPEGK